MYRLFHSLLLGFILTTIFSLQAFCQNQEAKDFFTLANCCIEPLFPKGEMNEEIDIFSRLEEAKEVFENFSSSNRELEYICNQEKQLLKIGINAINSIIESRECLENLPKPPGFWESFGSGFFDGLMWSNGIPSGLSANVLSKSSQIDSIQREEIENISTQLNILGKVYEKDANLIKQLVKLAFQYSSIPENNRGRIQVDFDEPLKDGEMDALYLKNTGSVFYDVTLIATITGENGNTVTDYFYIERWDNEDWYGSWLPTLTLGEHEIRRTAINVEKVKVQILSPTFSTTVEYDYDYNEKAKDILNGIRLRK